MPRSATVASHRGRMTADARALRSRGLPDRKPDVAVEMLPGQRHGDAGRTMTRGAGHRRAIVLEGADDDVIEIELQDGLRVWTPWRTHARWDFAARGARLRRGSHIPPAILPSGLAHALGGDWALKAFKVLGLGTWKGHREVRRRSRGGQPRPVPAYFDAVPTSHPAEQVRESRSGPCSSSCTAPHRPHPAALPVCGRPGGSIAQALFNRYGGRVLAFQHRTLSESPDRECAGRWPRASLVARPGVRCISCPTRAAAW